MDTGTFTVAMRKRKKKTATKARRSDEDCSRNNFDVSDDVKHRPSGQDMQEVQSLSNMTSDTERKDRVARSTQSNSIESPKLPNHQQAEGNYEQVHNEVNAPRNMVQGGFVLTESLPDISRECRMESLIAENHLLTDLLHRKEKDLELTKKKLASAMTRLNKKRYSLPSKQTSDRYHRSPAIDSTPSEDLDSVDFDEEHINVDSKETSVIRESSGSTPYILAIEHVVSDPLSDEEHESFLLEGLLRPLDEQPQLDEDKLSKLRGFLQKITDNPGHHQTDVDTDASFTDIEYITPELNIDSKEPIDAEIANLVQDIIQSCTNLELYSSLESESIASAIRGVQQSLHICTRDTLCLVRTSVGQLVRDIVSVASHQTSSLRDLEEQLEREKTNSSKECNGLRQAQEVLVKERDALKDEVSRVKMSLEQTESMYLAADRDCSELQSLVDTTLGAMAAIQEESNQLQTMLDTLKSLAMNEEQEYSKTLHNLSDMMAEKSSLKAEICRLKEEKDILSKKVEELTGDNREMAARLTRLETQDPPKHPKSTPIDSLSLQSSQSAAPTSHSDERTGATDARKARNAPATPGAPGIGDRAPAPSEEQSMDAAGEDSAEDEVELEEREEVDEVMEDFVKEGSDDGGEGDEAKEDVQGNASNDIPNTPIFPAPKEASLPSMASKKPLSVWIFFFSSFLFICLVFAFWKSIRDSFSLYFEGV